MLSLNRSLPPGPWGWPIVGSLPEVLQYGPEAMFAKWKDAYGAVVGVRFGSRYVVILNNATVVREALIKQKEIFTNRPSEMHTEILTKGPGIDRGLVLRSGEWWHEHRRFIMSVLRDFGMGRSLMEDKIRYEVEVLCTELQKNVNNKEFNPRMYINLSVVNVIISVLMNKSFGLNDQKFRGYIDKLDYLFEKLGPGNGIDFMPWIRFLPHEWKKLNNIKGGFKYLLDNFITPMLDQHRTDFDGETVDDYVDAYLKEQKTRPELFTDRMLQWIILDMFAAGSETTTTTLRWAISYMINNPHVQIKVQEELDRVVGQGRMPTMADKANLPYTMATLHEVERMGSIVPAALPHSNCRRTKLNGYDIPQDSFVIPNIRAVHYDADIWGDPDVFRPERFLDTTGQRVVKNENLMPFSVGPRACLGELLARMELVLFFTALFHRFTFKPPASGQLPPLKGVMGITNLPPAFAVSIEPR